MVPKAAVALYAAGFTVLCPTFVLPVAVVRIGHPVAGAGIVRLSLAVREAFLAGYMVVRGVSAPVGGCTMEQKGLSLRVGSALITAGITAVEAAGFGVLFLRLANKKQTLEARERFHDAVDRVFFLMRRYRRLPKVLPAGYGYAIQVVDAGGRVVSSTRDLRGRPRMAAFVPAPGRIHTRRTVFCPAGLRGRMTVWAVHIVPEAHRYRHGRDPLLIYTATPCVPWYGSRRLVAAVTVASAAVTAVAAVVAYRTTARALIPVEQIRSEVAEITATDLSRRVPVPDRRELKDVAETMNTTLSRLETAVADLRHFTSDASHDLRAPLAGIRLRMEEALTHPDDADWSQAAVDVLSGVDREQAIVTDLLTLTRLDTGRPPDLQCTDLGRLVAAELGTRPDGRVPITRDLRDGVLVDCDRLLIARLLTNLVDNAQRHAATQVTVTVTTRRPATADGPVAVLEVADDGEGIPLQDREKVFERFVRLQDSRERDSTSSGLGLPISRRIAHAHHGALTLETPVPPHHGARFVLRLPLSDG